MGQPAQYIPSSGGDTCQAEPQRQLTAAELQEQFNALPIEAKIDALNQIMQTQNAALEYFEKRCSDLSHQVHQLRQKFHMHQHSHTGEALIPAGL